MSILRLVLVLVCAFSASWVTAEVTLPNVFSDHMVLQQNHANQVWGKAAPGEDIVVTLAGVEKQTTANEEGKWSLALDPLTAGGPYVLVVRGDNTITIRDVLVGEVWICSGQSNMQWRVDLCYDADLEKVSANTPRIRMINFPNVGSQEPIWSHDKAQWKVCTPDTVGEFSAVGYFFGRKLLQTIDTPIGLVNNSWGGSAADAWINRDLLEQNEQYRPTLERWSKLETRYEELASVEDLSEEQRKELKELKRQMGGNQRPANIYNGVLKSHLGYGIRGAIWYQGESNTSRAYQYRDLFPLMIQSWRDEWKLGDFPFYWVQLADFQREKAAPSESAWAELREAQTMTLERLPNVGQAVIIDSGEANDIHPRNKVTVGERLARWALAHEYGVGIPCQSPTYKSMEKAGGKIVLSFDHVHRGWRPFDVKRVDGFAIAGADKKYVWAQAKILDDQRIEVWSDQVAEPVAVRYAWADNPVCNMEDGVGLPLTPFRTDDWPGVTVDKR